jgi:PAS domain S-box-containing protein
LTTIDNGWIAYDSRRSAGRSARFLLLAASRNLPQTHAYVKGLSILPLVNWWRGLRKAVLASCLLAGATANVALAAGGLDPVTLQLKWKHQFQFAGYYAAIAQGYYRDLGLQVTLREAEPDKDPVDAVLGGQAQYGVGTSDLMLLRGKGKPVVVLAVIFQHSPLILLARRGPGADDLQALAGQPIMIEPESAELFAYFKDEGIDPAKLNLKPHTFDVKDLIDGKVAAMSAYSTDEPYTLRQAGFPFMAFTPRSGGIDFYGDNLYTTESELRDHPARARAFRQASLKGWDYALAHPGEIIDLILRDYGQRKTREQLVFEADQTTRLIHPELIEVGHMNPGRWQHISETYQDFGMLPRGFSLKNFIYDFNPPPDYTWVWWIVGGISGLALAVFGWALPLRQLNLRLRQSEKQYRELVELAPFPVSVTDAESKRIIFANKSLGSLLIEPAAKLVGEAAADFYENPTDRGRLLAGLMNGPVTGFEVRLRSRGGGSRPWVLMSASMVDFAGRRGVLVAFQDITQQREMQEELRRAKEVAEAADAAKTHYLAVMTHEVRTPLSGIISLAHLVQDEALSEEQRENVRLIETTGESLVDLIGKILDYAKIEAGHMEVEKTPMETGPLLDDLFRLFSAPAQAKGLTLAKRVAPGMPVVALTDITRLRQILANLLSNAIKFTHRGGIEITANAERRADGKWRLRFQIRDTGIGLAADRAARIFRPYAQGDASIARRYGGTGLGLAISQRLAQLLGGEITLESTPGVGSTFTVEIVADAGN